MDQKKNVTHLPKFLANHIKQANNATIEIEEQAREDFSSSSYENKESAEPLQRAMSQPSLPAGGEKTIFGMKTNNSQRPSMV
jgi:hypothetical protein